jgi:glycerol-1-phosphate dehydrogenase [NAD(P)+]
MTRAGLGDALCRSSAQLDWLLSHVLLGTRYSEAGYVLQAPDEPVMLDTAAAAVDGDLEAIAALFRVLTLGAFGVCVIGTSHPGSMGEHSISHYIDMFARPHPGTLHGEQVGVATRTMTHLQEAMLRLEVLPALRPTTLDEADMRRRYGRAFEACRRASLAKALDGARAAALTERLADEWGGIRARLRALMLPLARLDAVMESAGVMRTGAALGLTRGFWQEAVGHAHEIRDRFSVLDLAWHTGLLEGFVEGER